MPLRRALACVLSALLLAAAPSLASAAEKPPKDTKPPKEAKPSAKDLKNAAPASAALVTESKPFKFITDVGATTGEQKDFTKRILRPITETANFFLKVYGLKGTCFEDYADHYSANKFEKTIRIKVWRKYEDFLKDFQERYKTKSIPGAFFGNNTEKDDYGADTGVWIREIGASYESMTDEQLLRFMYHEMGHLFMHTFILYQVEVPSWIEEGTAELFEYRRGNGTHPEDEREQREGWLVEMLSENSLIPWAEFIKVKNLDNLDFTWKDQTRSQIQYVQAWSVLEFMISNAQRQDAFIKMLHKFKSMAELEQQRLGGMGLSREAFREKFSPYLYSVQEKVFKECYGNDLLAVEKLWRDWIFKNYETALKKKPIMRYHRGDWQLIRARAAKEPEAKAAALDRAQALFKDCTTESPDLAEGYVGLGRISLDKGDLKEAGDLFAKAATLGSDSFDVLLYGGLAKLRSGKAAEAVAPLTKALEMRPTMFDTNFLLGQALAASGGDIDQTVACLKRARDLEAAQAPTCAFLEGAAQYQAGHLHDAYISFLRVQNLKADYPDIAVYMALAQAENNEREDAVKTLAQPPISRAASILSSMIAANKTLPKLIFTASGWPTLDFKAAQDSGDGAEKEAPAKDADAPEKAKDAFAP
jgi:tetratricopeptide (TPR) repeat protein